MESWEVAALSFSRIRTRGRSLRRNAESVSCSAAVQSCVVSTMRAPLCWMICASLAAGIVGSRGRNAPPARCTAIIAARKSMPRSVNKTTTSSRRTSSRQSRPAMAEARLASPR